MFNQLIVASVTVFSGTITPDKNGEISVMFQCIGGRMPNRNVKAGTVAKRAGFEEGKTYLINVREAGYDEEFGTDYDFIKVKELTLADDIIEAVRKLGPPQVFDVPKPKEFSYQRKSVAVEGLRTQRIKEGKYIPATLTTAPSHDNAKTIEGTSQEPQRDEESTALGNKEAA